MAETIGIKQADGNFYSILEMNSPVQKRLVLSTASEKQKSVQIDLYKSNTNTMAGALYIGSLVIENIVAKAKGTPSIEMTISLGSDGSVSANAVDLGDSSNSHHLVISLDSLEDDTMDYPDFEPDMAVYSDSEETEENAGKRVKGKKRKKTWLVIILAVLVLLGLMVFGVYFRPDLFRLPPQFKLPFRTKTESGVLTEKLPALSMRRAVQQTIPPEGITYKVREGDTLWDISEAFYRNPRHYTFIGDSNNIPYPAIVTPGTELTILPKR
jgi:hypothetical protein